MINYIIPQIDKLKHSFLWTLFFLCLSIFLIFFSVVIDLFFEYNIPFWVCVLTSLIATHLTASIKEWIIDYFGEGKTEFMDYFHSVLFPTLFSAIYFLSIFVNNIK